MNIFEGARRVAKVVAGLVVIGAAASAVIQKPSLSPHYALAENGDLQWIDYCDYSSPRFYSSVKGRPDISLTVCGYSEGPSEMTLDNAEIARIEKVHSDKRTADLSERFWYLAGFLILGWGACCAIGWIIRGFMGIPKGQDVK